MATELEPFYEELGKRLQGFRKLANLTQADLGGRLHPPLTRASMANIENGKQRVLAHTAVELAEVLDVGVEQLLPRPRRTKISAADPANLEQELISKLSISKDQARVMAAAISSSPRRT
jgi:transcriptional regulator with XRE-family HTH domain